MDVWGDGEGENRRIRGSPGLQPPSSGSGRRLGPTGVPGLPPRRVIGVAGREAAAAASTHRAFAAYEAVIHRQMTSLESQALTAALNAFQNPTSSYTGGLPSNSSLSSSPPPLSNRPNARKIASPPNAAPFYPAAAQTRPPPTVVKRPRQPWQPSEESDIDVTARTVKSILNKLTVERFDVLSDQLISCGVDASEESLRKTIDFLFDKALGETHFSGLYAELCAKLNSNLREVQAEDGSVLSFRKLLLAKCRQELVQKTQVKSASKAEAEQLLSRLRKRLTGNAIFVGELFKKSLISEKVMHQNVQMLLTDATKTHDEEAMDTLCKLLNVSGKMLDRPEAKNWMDVYFQRIEELSKEPPVTSRMRFMLRDIIELRASGWQSRRGEDGPKKIEQIHAEMEGKMSHTIIKKASDHHYSHPHNHGNHPNVVTVLQRDERGAHVSGAHLPASVYHYPHVSPQVYQYPYNNSPHNFHEPYTSRGSVPWTLVPPAAVKAAAAAPVLTPEQIKAASIKAINAALLEWTLNHDRRGLELSLSSEPGNLIVSQAVHLAIERKSSLMPMLAAALGVLSTKQIVSEKHVVHGFTEALKAVEVIQEELDMPRTAESIGSFAAHVVSNGTVSIAFLNTVIPFTPSIKRMNVLIAALVTLKEKMGKEAFYESCSSAGLNLSACVSGAVSDEELVNILQSRGLLRLLPVQSLRFELDQLVKSEDGEDAITTWVKEHMGYASAKCAGKEEYARAVSEVLLGRCIAKNWSESKPNLEGVERSVTALAEALRTAVGDDIRTEMQCAFAAQKACHDVGLPNGLLQKIFRTLYNVDVVSAEAFEEWREDISDPTEGKRIALYQVNAFVVWLSELSQEEDDEEDESTL